jgi:hypothetical protein
MIDSMDKNRDRLLIQCFIEAVRGPFSVGAPRKPFHKEWGNESWYISSGLSPLKVANHRERRTAH